jgi:hypothetical protein
VGEFVEGDGDDDRRNEREVVGNGRGLHEVSVVNGAAWRNDAFARPVCRMKGA